jgi:hypothetical protein
MRGQEAGGGCATKSLVLAWEGNNEGEPDGQHGRGIAWGGGRFLLTGGRHRRRAGSMWWQRLKGRQNKGKWAEWTG